MHLIDTISTAADSNDANVTQSNKPAKNKNAPFLGRIYECKSN
jgi:hypothetical protein